MFVIHLCICPTLHGGRGPYRLSLVLCWISRSCWLTTSTIWEERNRNVSQKRKNWFDSHLSNFPGQHLTYLFFWSSHSNERESLIQELFFLDSVSQFAESIFFLDEGTWIIQNVSNFSKALSLIIPKSLKILSSVGFYSRRKTHLSWKYFR